jgi:hypothetical protein
MALTLSGWIIDVALMATGYFGLELMFYSVDLAQKKHSVATHTVIAIGFEPLGGSGFLVAGGC